MLGCKPVNVIEVDTMHIVFVISMNNTKYKSP